ncbi:LexA regulated protein [Aeromonas schubertii]|uniref:LexA regulated protein n=1 Tax=Aeromonas schubertii TaxID=652 RepID=A0ABS7VCZ2_9GAMM|nr:LexA regulated protein [Aeromonas schubertii]KUE80343.1 LexA regulated protein [Aeromonas schubertii]MBZ6067249.1 LexA regulated protein [Aeromonas schubertii]QCG47579.1 LexA regulated protein [Aeromonas schubertii]
MAKQQADRTTLDLFANEKRPGRPKTNPLPREAQLKINKRNQLKRDRENGLKRVELKVEADLLERLNQLAERQNVSRAELIQSILKQQMDTLLPEAAV